MKKYIKKIFIGLGVLIGLTVILMLVFIIGFSQIKKQMSPAETHALNDTVFCIKDNYVNAFLFKGDNGYVMIDACISEKRVLCALEELDITAEEISALLLTHSDVDHIGATGLFSNAVVYMHSDEEQMVNGQMSKMGPFKYKWKFGDYKLFESKQTLELEGLQIMIHHTPGHSPGSVCFIINNDYLVTGDNLIYEDGKYVHFLKMPNMDTEMQIESLKTLPAPASFKYILTAHNGISKIER